MTVNYQSTVHSTSRKVHVTPRRTNGGSTVDWGVKLQRHVDEFLSKKKPARKAPSPGGASTGRR